MEKLEYKDRLENNYLNLFKTKRNFHKIALIYKDRL